MGQSRTIPVGLLIALCVGCTPINPIRPITGSKYADSLPWKLNQDGSYRAVAPMSYDRVSLILERELPPSHGFREECGAAHVFVYYTPDWELSVPSSGSTTELVLSRK
jgi:hypothetical protein